MSNIKHGISLLVAMVVAVAITSAHAGTGGSYARIVNAINTGSQDAIIAELERAEYLPCPSCVEPVMKLLDDPRYPVREVAAWWMSRRPAQMQEVMDRSAARLAGSDSTLARNAADALGAFRLAEAVPALAAAAARQDLSAEARAQVVRALGDVGHHSGSSALAGAMADGDAGVRLAAVTAWVQIRKQSGAQPVVALVNDADTAVRRKAAAVAGQLREASARQALEQRLASDADAAVRRNAAWALGRLGDSAARPALETAAQDPSGLVRMTARAALAQLR